VTHPPMERFSRYSYAVVASDPEERKKTSVVMEWHQKWRLPTVGQVIEEGFGRATCN
jgi:hypothetical protein